MGTRSVKYKLREVMNRLDEYVEKHNLRYSSKRNTVLEEACKLKQPFTAGELVEAAKRVGISQGSVYNAIELLCKARVLCKVNRDSTREHAMYEVIAGKSYTMQLYCTRCGRIGPVQGAIIKNAIKEYRFRNFTMSRFSLFVYGECKTCRRTYKRLF